MTAPTAGFADARALGPAALGTVEFGARLTADDSSRLLEHFAAAGGRLLDTAPTYGTLPGDPPGRAEHILGTWLERSGAPLRVATKVGLDPATRRPDLHPDRLYDSVQRSAARLRRNRIDLLLLHRDDPTIPLGELADVLHRLATETAITSVGCSNWSATRLDALAHHLAARAVHHTPDPAADRILLRATSPLWSLARRARNPMDAELKEALPADLAAARRHELMVLPYRAAALGWFSYTDSRPRGGGHSDYLRATYDTVGNRARRARARRVAAALGCTSHQVALAWLTNAELPVLPILGATSIEHLTESLIGCQLALTAAQRRYLTANDPI